MTLYNLTINPENIKKIGSTKILLDIGQQISLAVFRHVKEDVLQPNTAASREADTILIMFTWYMGILGRILGVPTNQAELPRIGHIYLEKRTPARLHRISHSFLLSNLMDTCPKLLAEFVRQVWSQFFDEIIEDFSTTSDTPASVWANKIMSLTEDILYLIGVGLGDSPGPIKFSSVMMRYALGTVEDIIDYS